jgi:hypothetical protein
MRQIIFAKDVVIAGQYILQAVNQYRAMQIDFVTFTYKVARAFATRDMQTIS